MGIQGLGRGSAALLLLFAGCGGGGGAQQVENGALDPALGGTWTGAREVLVNATPVGYIISQTTGNTMLVGFHQGNAVLTGVCPLGDGAVEAAGTGRSATWSGTLSCAPVSPSGCTHQITVTFLEASLDAAGTLTVGAGGSVTGCHVGGLVMSFVATR